MAESLAGEAPGISRRDALRIFRNRTTKQVGVVVAAAGILGAAGAVKENLTERTIETSSGRFTGVYEFHLGSKTRLPLPSDADILFREWSQNLSEIFDFPAYSNFVARHLPTQTVLEAAQRQIPIMFGDVKIDDHLRGYLISGGTTLVTASIGAESARQLQKMQEADREAREEGNKTDNMRRTLLKGGLVVTAAWGLSSVARAISSLAPAVVNSDGAREILSQCNNLLNAAHPEDVIYFFRNALMAEKLLHMAEVQQQVLGRNPHIAFSVGYGHRGIEDFLRAGRDVCRTVITAYPDFLLRRIVDGNGGIDAFSSSLLFQLPETLTEANIRSENLGGQATIINDNELKTALTEKLNQELTKVFA